MRHSSIDLTMNVDTDPKLWDVAWGAPIAAVAPVSGDPQTERSVIRATGTDDYRLRPLAPPLAPTADETSKSWSSPDNSAANYRVRIDTPRNAVSATGVKEKRPLTNPVNERLKVETRGLAIFHRKYWYQTTYGD
jgi:hypothetical protein